MVGGGGEKEQQQLGCEPGGGTRPPADPKGPGVAGVGPGREGGLDPRLMRRLVHLVRCCWRQDPAERPKIWDVAEKLQAIHEEVMAGSRRARGC